MRASATIACRALVMLGCLVIIPLAAVSGSSLTQWVDTALTGKWPWADRPVTGSQADPQFELMPPDEAVWPANLRAPARVARPAGAQIAGVAWSDRSRGSANAPGTQVRGPNVTGAGVAQPAQPASAAATSANSAVVPAGWDAPVVCRDGMCRLGGTGAAPGAPDRSSAAASALSSDPQAASPYHRAGRSALLCPPPVGSGAGQAVAARAPGSDSAGQLSEAVLPGPLRGPVQSGPPLETPGQDRFGRLGQRLQQLGATYYLLEHWGNGQYRFYCRMAVAGSPRLTQDFEQLDTDPLQAMSRVVEQVEAWRTAVP